LLDVCSQSNVITESLAKKLNLNLSNNNISIQGINKKIITSKQSTTVTIKSRVNTFSSEISCLVLPKITGKIPEYPVKNLDINIPEDIQLADPNFQTISYRLITWGRTLLEIIRFRKNIITGTTPPDRNISRLVGWRRNLEKLANKRCWCI
jgi:hypothetical protein